MKTAAVTDLREVTIIIRSAGERTEQLCKELILSQGVPESQLFVVQEVPFSASMKRSFKIGMEEGRKWTFCVDADLLLRPGAISDMVRHAEKQKSHVCEIQGYVMDKFFGGPRQAGNHLYRTELLGEVIRRIPEEGTSIRPERYTLGKMEEDGYPWRVVPCVTGIHDEEQYNRDIYRKAFVQGVKHLERAGLFIGLWRERADTDPDYKVALKGFADSVLNHAEVYINKEQPLYNDLFDKAAFGEKEPLPSNALSPEAIGKKIEEWASPEIYFRYFPTRDGLDDLGAAALGKWKKETKEAGLLRGSLNILGSILVRTGKRLRS